MYWLMGSDGRQELAEINFTTDVTKENIHIIIWSQSKSLGNLACTWHNYLVWQSPKSGKNSKFGY